MNEQQYDCLNDYERAKATWRRIRDQLEVAEQELEVAEQEMFEAEQKLVQAVQRDQPSWYGTPGIERYLT